MSDPFEIRAIADGSWRSITYNRFTFPDGQPHIELEYGSKPCDRVYVTARLRNPQELFELLMVHETLTRCLTPSFMSLYITYLMGARMDRPMPTTGNSYHPFTLGVVTAMINSVRWDRVEILDPHSDVAPALLGATVRSPNILINRSCANTAGGDTLIVSPDAGADKRLTLGAYDRVQCLKHRDMSTGKLSGFQILNPEKVKGRKCLIVDDLCDGGGTFIGIGKLLRDAGAELVNLYVTHGIFSKGYDLDYIDRIYTTNSYDDHADAPEHVKVLNATT